MIKIYQLRKVQNSYEVTLHYKGVQVRVAFTGGNVYKGTMPRLRTDNAFKMKAIESSEMFKNKEVVVVRTIETKHEEPTVVKPQRKVVMRPDRRVAPVSMKTAGKPVDADVADTVLEPNEDGSGEASMTFDNLGEAIQYIAQTWEVGVKSEAEARKVLKEHGITPRIKKG